MQYITVIALLAATFGGVQAWCNNPNFNTYNEAWPEDMFSGRSGAISTVQQVCTDINKDFKSDEEKWDCRRFGTGKLLFKTSIKKVGQVNSEQDGKLDEGWCKSMLAQIIDDCELGGGDEVSSWKFTTTATETECGE